MDILEEGVFYVQYLEQARSLAKTLAQACPDPGKILVGLQEILINAVEHGNLGIDYADKKQLMLENRWLDEINRRQNLIENQNKRVKVSFLRTSDWITITVEDQGAGFDWQSYLELDPERAIDPHGRGIALARLLSFDSLNFLGTGNTVVAAVNCSHF
jgi:anti-sigma regulatory factor (Ser/Thr protein kinase)